MKYIVTLTLVLSLTLLATISKAQMRLMGKAHRTYVSTGNIIEDSTRYFHSGAKGTSAGKYKIPEFEVMEDSSHVFTKSGTGVKWVGRKVTLYNGSDFNYSTYYTWSDSANNWRNNLRTRIIYASNKPDTVYYDTWSSFGSGSWRASTRIMYTWNSNNIATQTRQTRGFGGANPPWTNRERYTYTWASGNETEMIIAKWKSGAWEDSFKRTTTYTAGKATDVSTFKWNGSTWGDDTKSTYAYDGNSRLLTIKRDIYTGVWEPNRIDTFMYLPANTTPYADTIMRISYLLGSFNNEGKFAYEHLSDGRPTQLVTMSWDGSAWKQTNNQDSIDNWYYDWNVNVENIDLNNSKISIYPSPANTTIHITLGSMVQDKHIQFAIMDMQGRVVKNWSEYSKAETTMSVNDLPSGNYILNVNDGTFKGVRKFTVSK